MSLCTVFFDADALIAGSASTSGAAFALLQLCELGLIKGYTSERVILECRRNLAIKVPQAVDLFEQIVARSLVILPDLPVIKDEIKTWAHPKDLPILGVALAHHVEFLVTFNIRHFYPPQSSALRIATPATVLQHIRTRLAGEENAIS